ncbi:MAG: NYN domain-containing protein, partial [Longicatena sp.]
MTICWTPLSIQSQVVKQRNYHVDDAEVERVMRMTYGEVKPRVKEKRVALDERTIQVKETKPQCFIVDGYNIIHDWENLKEMARENLDAARNQLTHYMSSFQGYKKCVLILVFDAYNVPERMQKEYYNGSIYIVYTKTAQTADSYIEKTTHELAEKYNITVATSDALEQLIVSAQGARRMS